VAQAAADSYALKAMLKKLNTTPPPPPPPHNPVPGTASPTAAPQPLSQFDEGAVNALLLAFNHALQEQQIKVVSSPLPSPLAAAAPPQALTASSPFLALAAQDPFKAGYLQDTKKELENAESLLAALRASLGK
jgi:hypothetical protein